jgi:hypothetical protein
MAWATIKIMNNEKKGPYFPNSDDLKTRGIMRFVAEQRTMGIEKASRR